MAEGDGVTSIEVQGNAVQCSEAVQCSGAVQCHAVVKYDLQCTAMQ